MLEGQAESAITTAVGFGVGLALSGVLAPVGTGIEQAVWAADPNKVLDPETAAKVVAEAIDQLSWGSSEAEQSGINPDRFAKMVAEIIEAPGFGELVRMLRRESITPDLFAHGLRKHKLDAEWDTALTDLANERLDPAVIADGIQRRVAPDPGYLIGALPIDGSSVPILSDTGIDPVTEAKASGIDSARLAFLTKISGLPPAPGELLSLLNRGEINEAAFALGIAQGHTRNEWGPALLTLKRRLLTPHEYEEAALRGVIPNAAADTGAALSGMEAADAQILFAIMGRPLAVHAITTGLARGGTFGGTYSDIPEPYRDAVRRSNIRPEYAVLAHANRYNLPSPFVMRNLTQTHVWSEDKAHTRLLMAGWIPEDAAEAAAAWAGGTTATADPHVTKAETQLWSATHKAFVDGRADDTTATGNLETVGVVPGSVPKVLALWYLEREVHRAGLSAAEIKKTAGLKTWTEAERMARLADLGYSPEDATTFLAE